MGIGQAVGGFSVVAGLLTIVPGSTPLVLRAAVTQGRRAALLTALGINTGALVWGAAAAVGVSALLTASTVAYTTLRLAGACYMVWVGGRMLLRAWRRPPATPAAPGEPAQERHSGWRAWRRGVLTNLLNPKIGAFYLAVLPQFLPAGHSPLAMGLLLALVHDLMGMAWFGLLVLGIGRVHHVLRRPRAQRLLDVATGSVLVGFGVRLGAVAR